MYVELAILAGFIFAYSILSQGLERTPINGAVVFVGFGLLMGPMGLGWLDLPVDGEVVSVLAEMTLALLLFSDAANANLKELRHAYRLPLRLLLIGLPMTILLGVGVGVWLFDELGLLEVAILATMLAPTDAALGKAVVTNEAVPPNIREGLNVESGLNDGICVPILFIFLALVAQSVSGDTTSLAVRLTAEAIGIGVGVGVGVTWLGVSLLEYCERRSWVGESWQQICVPALSIGCFATAQGLGGSGFIACFVGGLLFGRLERLHKARLLEAAEGAGDTLALLTWVVFGAGLLNASLASIGWEVVAYAVLSLTVVRILPVFAALLGSGLRPDETLFIGWFGPRGLASIVFAILVLDAHLPGAETITQTVVCTILLSVLAHGLTANPLVARLKARLSA